jgi:hypothetical protein
VKAVLREHALTIVLLIVCAALTVALLRRGGAHRTTIAVDPAVAIGRDLSLPGLRDEDDLLARTIPELRLPDDCTLQQAFDMIERAADCRIDVNWAGLLEAHLDGHNLSDMTGHFHNITVADAIRRVLDKDTLGCTAHDGVIFIDRADHLSTHAVTCVYNVRDILQSAAEYWAAGAPVTNEDLMATLDVLTQLITDSIATDTWRDNGGNTGMLEEVTGLLIVTQTRECQRAMARLLDDIRKTSRIDPIKAFQALSRGDQNSAAQPDDAAAAALARMLPPIDSPAPRTLEEGLQLVQAAGARPMFVEWKELEPVGIERSSPLKLDWPLPKMNIREALLAIGRSAGRDVEVTVTRQRGTIIVTTADALPRYAVDASYNIRELIDAAVVRSRAQVKAGKASAALTPKEAAEQITHSLTDFIDPPTWRDNGGQVGAVMGLLYVRQTPENQDAVRRMLAKMR